MSWVFTIGGQSIGIPASASVLPMNIQGWFPFGLTSLISLPGTFKSLLQHHISKALILRHSAFSSIQLLSHVQLFATPWTAACQASLSITNSQNLPKLMFIESVMPSNHIIFCHPLLLLLSIFPSIRVFSNESALHIWWPKYWRFSFSPSNEYLGLISFRIDWFYLLAVQGTLKSRLQHHSSKASILRHSAFFMVQLTSVNDYWKNHSFGYMDLCGQSDASAF